MLINEISTDMMTKARNIVAQYFNTHTDVTNNFNLNIEDVYVVWFSKTLQNWKALVSTNIPDGMYYEVTYDGDMKRAYLDAYKKWANVVIPDSTVVLDNVD